MPSEQSEALGQPIASQEQILGTALVVSALLFVVAGALGRMFPEFQFQIFIAWSAIAIGACSLPFMGGQ